MTTVQAVYEGGVLRPVHPLPLAEGETVEVTVAQTRAKLSQEEWERRIRAAKNIQEWVELANTCPYEGPDVDILKMINESRRLTGFRVPDLEKRQGESG
jgi:predicted DNA-binding antitoxin AbrB/MazE fold protein